MARGDDCPMAMTTLLPPLPSGYPSRKLKLKISTPMIERIDKLLSTHTAQRTLTPAHCTQRTDAQKGIATKYKQEQADKQTADIALNPLMDSEALGRLPYFMLPQVISDREERESAGVTANDYGKRWRATFRGITGDAPVCGPGDRETARQYAIKVQTAIRQGGWSPSEWGSLSRAEKVWLRRANGLDPRFEVVGTRPGRLPFEQRERVRALEMAYKLAEQVNGRKYRVVTP